MSGEVSVAIKPFLRWAGGKTWLLKELHQFLPEEFNNYHEPFMGGAAVFFHLKQLGRLNGEVILSDLNRDLTQCFTQVRDNVEAVIEFLETYRNDSDFYYAMRELAPTTKEEKAARFLYLNRTSFNGIYRVNLKGVYNVPYGFKEYKALFDYDNLRRASALLEGVQIVHRDFKRSLASAGRGDLVFLDPPYTVAHNNNGFVKYNQKIFAWKDQRRLASTTQALSERRASFILTNAAQPSIERLFGPLGRQTELRRFSVIGGKNAKRDIRSEYVFWNSDCCPGGATA